MRDVRAKYKYTKYLCFSLSWSLWNPRGHRKWPSDRGELWIPRHRRVPVSAWLPAHRLVRPHLSPRQPVVRTAAHLHT